MYYRFITKLFILEFAGLNIAIGTNGKVMKLRGTSDVKKAP